jgi:hypothetical protein
MTEKKPVNKKPDKKKSETKRIFSKSMKNVGDVLVSDDKELAEFGKQVEIRSRVRKDYGQATKMDIDIIVMANRKPEVVITTQMELVDFISWARNVVAKAYKVSSFGTVEHLYKILQKWKDVEREVEEALK